MKPNECLSPASFGAAANTDKIMVYLTNPDFFFFCIFYKVPQTTDQYIKNLYEQYLNNKNCIPE